MGAESTTKTNECAYCYAFDAEHIAFPPRAATTLAPQSDPPTAERPANCGKWQAGAEWAVTIESRR